MTGSAASEGAGSVRPGAALPGAEFPGAGSAARPGAVGAWLAAARPRTLVVGVVPVLVGSAIAWHEGSCASGVAAAALAVALFIQIGTNLVNDAMDFRRGADTSARVGPARASQRGWLSPRAVLAGAAVCGALALLAGAYLAARAGAELIPLGLLCLAAGYAYTGGPYPLAYHGLGDVFVFVFFGLVAVGGTVYVQLRALPPEAFLAGAGVGALGVAMLAVNNLRDAATDAAAGKRTLVVRWGPGFGRLEYTGMLLAAALVPVLACAWLERSPFVLAALLAAPLALGPLRLVWRATGARLNEALAGTARLIAVYGSGLALGLLP